MPAYASLASLLAPPAQTDNLTQLLALLELGGFPATAWDSGSSGPVFANTEAAMFVSLGSTLALIAKGGYLPQFGSPASGAQGVWLDLLGNQIFRSPRNPATWTSGVVSLTDAASAGPFTIQPNALTVEDPSKTYLFGSTNASPLILPLNGTLPVPVQAAAQGSAYNLASGQLTVLVTSLAGVTVSNPPVGSTGTWITTVGTNAETDALYATRLGNKWAILGSGSNEGAYYFNATTPSVTGTTEVVQCAVFASGGLVTVVVSGATQPISAAGLALVNAAIQKKRPLTVPVQVINAIPSNTPFTGTVLFDSVHDPVAGLSAVQVAVSGVLQTVKIGGQVDIDLLIATVRGVPGVTNWVPTPPAIATTPGPAGGYLVAASSQTQLTPLFQWSSRVGP